MIAITGDFLRAVAASTVASLADALAPEFDLQFGPASINSNLRVAHFLGQTCYETGYFKRLEESLSYGAARIPQVWPRLADRAEELANNPHALGNAAYAGINGNGDEASGDGWLFRGRGCVQLTGRANYAAASKLCEQDFVAEPDLVSQPHWAVASAVAFWTERNINSAADEDDIAKVTRLVTGSSIALAERASIKHRVLKLLAGSNST